ncbi:RNA methyltransferase [uncultured Kriegella sp.]|uniref:TrmH family RNA methyltransferase n=1 Tax=uncultured Kriegella sp. TaxID=1798910 RepID=UPI0030DC0460|tara:strand:+ start:282019 stop:282828 length:810 start_codon:yes stop_codon:yes gene_type:complete
MNEIKHISSAQNPLVKKILLLKEKSRERKKLGLFILEGARELQMALKADYQIQTLVFCPEIIKEFEVGELLNGKATLEVIAISKLIYQKIAHRATTEGILAIAKSEPHALSALDFKNKNPLILVAEAPEKPGNIGALLRTADAANLDAIIIANAKGDLYNPNIIRSSVGCVFTTKIAMGSTSEIISFLKENNVAIYCAALTASERYTQIDFKQSAAIVVGTEATGLSEEWLQNATKNIIIPMLGEIDSMNVSVSAAILIFEAKRQRDFK